MFAPGINATCALERITHAVDERLRVNVLDSQKRLVGEHQDGLEREAAAAAVEKVLQRVAEQIHDEHVVAALRKSLHARGKSAEGIVSVPMS